jgi:hypothetical protein
MFHCNILKIKSRNECFNFLKKRKCSKFLNFALFSSTQKIDMKKYRLIFVGVGVLAALSTFAQTKKKISQIHTAAKKHTPISTKSVVLKNQFDSLSYAIGISMAKFYKAQGVENLNIPVLNKAIEDGMHGDST